MTEWGVQNYLKLTEVKHCSECEHDYYICKCKCGNIVKLNKREFIHQSRSCGCMRKEAARKQGLNNTTHGAKKNGKIEAEYRIWTGMKNRCLNHKDKCYYRYGGRGIQVYPAWKDSYSAFLHDVGRRPSPKHSLDRINNDGNYEPGNVRWATAKEQANNRHYGNRWKKWHK